MNVISKEEFCDIIDELKHYNDYQRDLNKLYRKYDIDGFIFQPDCSCSTIKLLKFIFSDDGDWINYFCNELEYGKRWKPGCVKEDGIEIKLETSEDLYDYLTN